MRRDFDLIRQLLQVIEEGDYPAPYPLGIEGREQNQINYHLLLMQEAGLIDATVSKTLGPGVPRVQVFRLSWEGHEFLEAARNTSAWKDAVARVSKSTGGLAFEVLKCFLIELAKSKVLTS